MRKPTTRADIMFAVGLALGASLPALAATPQDMLRDYEAAARSAAAGFKPSAERGAAFFRNEHLNAAGEKTACAACHTPDPRQVGKTRAHKPIEPLAPAINAARFTDTAKAEKWFGRNCQDVLGRACTPSEKADFIAWLLTVK